MSDTAPATVPAQPESTPPLKKRFPIVIVLVIGILLFGIANVSSLVSGKKKVAQNSAFTTRPASANPQQVKGFEAMQATEAKNDTQDRQAQLASQGLEAPGYDANGVPSPEADGTAPMTAAQRQAIYGNSPNAPQQVSNTSQGHAEAQQRALERAKERQDALNSDTVAIDFQHTAGAAPTSTSSAPAQPQTTVLGEREQGSNAARGEDIASGQQQPGLQPASEQRGQSVSAKTDPMADYNFDDYQGQLYRVFEGTVLEGVVTNHINGEFNGPILVMLTTDYYSHDHQQLLMPQGTRLIGNVQSVGSAQQRKLFVTFHRAVCPDGFSLGFDKYIGLDPIGTTGLASKVDNHILSAFAAAAAIGGLGGLAQIGNSASILDPSAELRDGITSQASQEGEQILNHFLNRLPTITLKEGSRARIYIGRDILIPSYSEHRVNPAL
jgi:type IV secretory pathway VirB10-like protein